MDKKAEIRENLENNNILNVLDKFDDNDSLLAIIDILIEKEKCRIYV